MGTNSKVELTPATPTKRRRGAQPGNTNALKHGFYSAAYTDLEISDLETVEKDGLDDEIELARIISRRLVKLMKGVNDLDQVVSCLNALGMANIRLASLLRTKKLLKGESSSDFVSILAEALSSVRGEMGL